MSKLTNTLEQHWIDEFHGCMAEEKFWIYCNCCWQSKKHDKLPEAISAWAKHVELVLGSGGHSEH